MAIFLSDVAERYLKGKLVSSADIQAELRLASVAYSVSGTESVGDVIELVRLPMGARLVPALSFVWSEGVGATLSVKMGDGGDDARFGAAMAVATAGVYPVKGGTGEAGSLVVDGAVKLSVASVSGLSAGKSIRCYLVYSIS